MNKDTIKDELIAKYSAKPGYAGKVIANSIDCTYDPYSSGSWRQQITDCKIVKCSLYTVRPTSHPKKD